MSATENEGVAPPTPLKSFYVTFGIVYLHEPHPYWKGADPEGYLEIQAPDEDAARLLARSFIGTRYAFIYDREPEWAQHGRLATITTNGGIFPVEGVEPPTPQFGTSDPEYYGHDSDEVVCARIEGTLAAGSDKDCIEALGYEAEHVHLRCFPEGMAMFREVTDVDYRVLAGELDWAVPYECPVCNTSIT